MEASRPTQAEVQALLSTLNNTNIQKATLTSICVVNGLPKTGNKPDLLARIVRAVNDTSTDRDLQRFKFIRESVNTRVGKVTPQSPPPQSSSAAVPHSTSSHTSMSYGSSRSNSQGYYGANYGSGGNANHSSNGYRPQSSSVPSQSQGIQFKKSPFFEVLHRVGQLKTCEIMEQHRTSKHFAFKTPDDPWLQRTVTDPSLRVMVLCAAGNTGEQDISFPHQSELKVNGDDVKANLRGLKNKPGSTRPADITNSLRLNKPAYGNTVDFTYALTRQIFYVGIFVCKVTSVSTLVEKIQQHGKHISKASVIAELTRNANDPDLVATSQVVSLKCPLSYMRLKIPVRGIGCIHVSCFDALSYLQLQEQGPQWLCPICNKSAPFEQLAADEYMKDILVNTSDLVDQITIEPNGNWLQPDAPKDAQVQSQQYQDSTASLAFDLDDDDLFEISEANPNGLRSGSQRTPSVGTGTPKTFGMSGSSYLGTPNFGTPNLATPKTTASPRPVPGSNKRPAAEVIDLTLSDDDEPASPPAKRPNYGGNSFLGNYPTKY